MKTTTNTKNTDSPNMIYFIERDLSESSEKTHTSSAPHTSRDSTIYTLRADKGPYKAGMKFLVKQNQFTWIVTEYVASKLYQYLLGEDQISNTTLIYSPTKLKVAIQLDPDFKTNFSPFHINCDVKGFSFKCLINPCPKLKHKDKIVQDFANAFVASRILDEGDDGNCNNYAMAWHKKEGRWIVRRYDADGSLEFLFIDNIDPGMTKDSVSEALAEKFGVQYTLDFINGNRMYHNSDMTWNAFYAALGGKLRGNKFNKPTFFKAMKKFQNLDLQTIDDIIKKAFEDISELVDENTFIEHYNTKALKEQVGDAVGDGTVDQLVFFIATKIHARIEALKNMGTCLGVQIAVENDDLPLLHEILGNHSEWTKLECQNPDYTLSPTLSVLMAANSPGFPAGTFPICDFAKLTGTETARELNKLCIQHHDEL